MSKLSSEPPILSPTFRRLQQIEATLLELAERPTTVDGMTEHQEKVKAAAKAQMSEAFTYLKQELSTDKTKDDLGTWMLGRLLTWSFTIGTWSSAGPDVRKIMEIGERNAPKKAALARKRDGNTRDKIVAEVAGAFVARKGLWPKSALGLAKKLLPEVNERLHVAELPEIKLSAVRSRLAAFMIAKPEMSKK